MNALLEVTHRLLANSPQEAVPDPSLRSLFFTITSLLSLAAQIFKEQKEGDAMMIVWIVGQRSGVIAISLLVRNATLRSAPSRVWLVVARTIWESGNQVLTSAHSFTGNEIDLCEVL
jgi:hypothetical protein